MKKSKIASTEPARKDFIDKIVNFYEIKGQMPTLVSDIGLVGTGDSIPDNIPSSLSEYAVPPYVMYESFSADDGIPGQCPYIQIAQYLSNFDSTGAYTTTNDTANYVQFLILAIKTNSGVWQSVCQIADTMDTDLSGGAVSSINSACYNMNSTAGGTAFETRVDELLATCP